MSLRQDIINESRDLLIKHGFGNISMRKIAKRANITATSIYLHFKSKDDLLLALIEESIENLDRVLRKTLDPSKGSVQQLEILASAFVHYALNHPQEYEIIYMVRPEEMPRYPKEKFKQVRSIYELLADIIEEGQKNEQLDVENPLISAYTLWAQLHGIITVILNKRLDTRIPQDQFIEHAIERTIQGFITQKTPA
jgi:AcrR family transcriptional regulator